MKGSLGEKRCKNYERQKQRGKGCAVAHLERAGITESSSSTVAVLGSLHLDIMVNAPDRPRKGETLPGSAWSYKAGGKGGNQAVAAAQFGAQAFMIGRVGDDDFGKRLLSHLQVLRSTRSTCEPTRPRVPE